MPIEIERKFLVVNDDWRTQIRRSQVMAQGYLGSYPANGEDLGRSSVRVRIAGDAAYLNIKSRTPGASRLEFEYPVPLADARQLLAQCANTRIEKTRHYVPWEGYTFEVDEFAGRNQGLVVAELELADEHQTFPRPPWLGAEVTDDTRYYNNELARHPWSEWTNHEH